MLIILGFARYHLHMVLFAYEMMLPIYDTVSQDINKFVSIIYASIKKERKKKMQ